MASPTRREFLAAPLALAPVDAAARPPAPPTGMVLVPGGRRLAFTEYGNPAGGRVVIHHHSLPAARREAEVFLTTLAGLPDVRLLSFDRPGFGDSDPAPDRPFAGWAPDLLAAADALGIGRFGVTAFSAGTAFALAVAVAAPDRVTRVSVGCPAGEHRLGRFNGTAATTHRLSRATPRAAETLLSAFARRVQRSPGAVFDLVRPLAPRERQLRTDPAATAFVATVLLDGLKQGPAAAVREGAAFAGRWGLPLGRVAAPVTVWHGSDDRFSPSWKGERLAREVPAGCFHESAGDGHLSLPASRAAEVLAAALD